jgi:hypothetical protein
VKRALLVLSFLLAACGGGSHGPAYTTPRDLAVKLHCAGSYNPERGAIAPGDVGTCRFLGNQLTLVTGTNAERDATVKFANRIAARFGRTGTDMTVEGDGWAVMADNAGDAASAQAILGGKII